MIEVRIARDTVEEESLVEKGFCNFAITDRSTNKKIPTTGQDYALYVSTKEDPVKLQKLLDLGALLCDARTIKRFGLHCSLETCIEQLRSIYGQIHVA